MSSWSGNFLLVSSRNLLCIEKLLDHVYWQFVSSVLLLMVHLQQWNKIELRGHHSWPNGRPYLRDLLLHPNWKKMIFILTYILTVGELENCRNVYVQNFHTMTHNKRRSKIFFILTQKLKFRLVNKSKHAMIESYIFFAII